MISTLLKVLEETAEITEEVSKSESKTYVLIAVIVFIIFAILLFVYLASCIIIVKQGTRKIVERFGSYNRTLKEGIHIIFRPFDKIAAVPWNVLSITERDNFDKLRSRKRIPFYNDGKDSDQPYDTGRDLKRLEESRAQIYKKLEKDIRILMREKYLDNSEEVSAALSDTLDIDEAVYNSTGRRLGALIDDVVTAEDSLSKLESSYKEMGLDFYRADRDLIDRVREKDALAASVKYYPRHQDPHSVRAGKWRMAENHIQDFVDLRERHIDTSTEKVHKLFISKKNLDIVLTKADADLSKFTGIKLITKDNASIGANIVIFFSITDPFLYYYGVDEPEESLVLLAITTLRNIVSTLTLEEALQARTEINKTIRHELDIATNNWGIKANRVEIKEFELGAAMQKAMDDVLIAEREKRANILRAEAYRKMKDDQVMEEHLKLKGYETLEQVSKGSANKVFIPNDLSDFITGAHVVADAFGEAKNGAKQVKKAKKDVVVKEIKESK